GATSPYCTFYQGYNTTKPPFDDANVRLAFSKAFDRQQYVEDILSGIGTVNMSFMPPGLPAYDNTDDTQKFDAAAAKQLLSGSKVSHTGWKNDQFDTLVRQADAEPDAAKRESQYKQAQKILTKDAPAGFVYTNAAWTLVKPWVQGWNLTPLDSYFSQLAQYNMVITTAKPK